MKNINSFDKMRNFLRFDYDKRRDARKCFKRNPIPLSCETADHKFNAMLVNVSTSGIFIETEERLEIGKEIAIKFHFPNTKKIVMATGEVSRIGNSGVGVRIKIFFNK